jgi:hypothetical protein
MAADHDTPSSQLKHIDLAALTKRLEAEHHLQAAACVGRGRFCATMTGGIDGHVGNAPLAEFLRGGS